MTHGDVASFPWAESGFDLLSSLQILFDQLARSIEGGQIVEKNRAFFLPY